MMQEQTPKQKLTRRAVILGAANLGIMSALVGRLYYLQFMRAKEYTMLSEGNRVKLQLIAPVRGLIMDRSGLPLANNQKNFRLFLDIEMAKKPDASLKALQNVLAISEDKLALAKVAHRKAPILLKEHLTWDEVSQFEFFRLNYPEVFMDVGQIRYYPLGENASHLIGYVGAVSPNEAKEVDEPELANLPDFKVGKGGVEKMMEHTLRGEAGMRQTEVNVHGLAVRDLGRTEGKPGKDTRLTIDATLQQYAATRLAGESAAAIVMNVRNGDVLALVSMPGFDPNSFSKGISAQYWGQLQANIRNPLLNKSIAGQYPPGSTFKLSMGLAALNEGVIDTSSRVNCNGRFMLGSHPFTCWKTSGHGSVNLKEAIEQSCDVFFYTMADRLGINPMASMARKLGLGKITNLGLPGEKPGVVPDEEWKRTRYNQQWQGGDTINVGIGQGYILTTPLQLAVMTSRIANGGFAVTPRLIIPVYDSAPKSLGIRDDYIAAIQEGMNAVTNGTNGTARGARISDTRFVMAGKTGTSQVRKLIQHGLDQNKLPWEDRHHAWFVGYAPVAAPRYAAAVIIEHGGSGAAAAAPVVRDILLKIQSMDAGEEGPALPNSSAPSESEEID